MDKIKHIYDLYIFFNFYHLIFTWLYSYLNLNIAILFEYFFEKI